MTSFVFTGPPVPVTARVDTTPQITFPGGVDIKGPPSVTRPNSSHPTHLPRTNGTHVLLVLQPFSDDVFLNATGAAIVPTAPNHPQLLWARQAIGDIRRRSKRPVIIRPEDGTHGHELSLVAALTKVAPDVHLDSLHKSNNNANNVSPPEGAVPLSPDHTHSL